MKGVPVHPLAMGPRGFDFRKMLAWSGVFHVAVGALFVFVGMRHAPHWRVPSVAVVDLIGGEAFSGPPAASRPAPSRPSAPPSRPERKSPARAERTKTVHEKAAPRPAAKPSAAMEEPKAAPKPEPKVAPKPTPAAAPAPSDAASVGEAIGKIRRERSESDRVREEVAKLRYASAARSAVQNVRERVAHRVDLSSLRPSKEGPPAPAAGSGSAGGNVRLPPEYLEYFRALDDKVRSNWIVPGLRDEEMKRLMVQVLITIEKDGRVSDKRMEKSSGNRIFDESVLRAIEKSSPLPVPPEKLRGGEDHYDVGFRFYGSGGTP